MTSVVLYRSLRHCFSPVHMTPLQTSLRPGIGKVLGEVLFLLGLVSIAHNLVEAEVGVSTVTEPHCSRSSGYLFHHQHLFQVAQAGAAILNWEWRRGSTAEKAAQITLGHSQECLPAAKKYPCSSYSKLPPRKVDRLTPWALLYQLTELALSAASGQLRCGSENRQCKHLRYPGQTS